MPSIKRALAVAKASSMAPRTLLDAPATLSQLERAVNPLSAGTRSRVPLRPLQVIYEQNGVRKVSEREEDFYQIELPVKGHPTIQHALGALVEGERLGGENAYRPPSGGDKVEAQKRICLGALPATLIIQLKVRLATGSWSISPPPPSDSVPRISPVMLRSQSSGSDSRPVRSVGTVCTCVHVCARACVREGHSSVPPPALRA